MRRTRLSVSDSTPSLAIRSLMVPQSALLTSVPKSVHSDDGTTVQSESATWLRFLSDRRRKRARDPEDTPGGLGTRSQSSERGGGTMSTKHIGSSLSSFLDEMKIRE